jgi:hypothetical protein
MRRIRSVSSGLLVAGFILGFASLPGCSDEQTPDVSEKKVSKRDEAGKKFPFAESTPVKKGAGAGGKAR